MDIAYTTTKEHDVPTTSITAEQVIDLRADDPRHTIRFRILSVWSRLPSLGPVNTAEYVSTLYQ